MGLGSSQGWGWRGSGALSDGAMGTWHMHGLISGLSGAPAS